MPKKYVPKKNPYYITLSFIFIFMGLFFTYLNRNEIGIIERYFPLFFTISGIIFLIGDFSKKYFMKDDMLIIKNGLFRLYKINYEKIKKIERRKINPYFKYGKAGYIRGETDLDVLVITFLESNRLRKIMISPKEMESFIKEINKKCPNLS